MNRLSAVVAALLVAPMLHASTPPPRPAEHVTAAATTAALAKLASPDERIRTDGLDELLNNPWVDHDTLREAVTLVALEDTSVNARLRALLLLQQSGDRGRQVREVITQLAGDRSPDVRYQAKQPLPVLSQKQSLVLRRKTLTFAKVDRPDRFFQRVKGASGLAWVGFAGRGKPFEAKLLALAANPAVVPAVRLDAIELLSEAYQDMPADIAAVTSLVPCLTDRGWQIRAACAIALGFSRQAQPAALDALRVRLGDPIDVVGAAAAQALGEIRPPVAARHRLTQALLSAFDSGLSTKRIWAATSLGVFKAKAAAAPLAQAVATDRNLEVQLNGLLALAEIGPAGTAAIPHLQAILSDPGRPPMVLRETLSVLGHMGSGAAPAVPEIAKMLASETGELVEMAVIALGKIGPPSDSVAPALGALFHRTIVASPRNDRLLDRISRALGDIATDVARVELEKTVELRGSQNR